MDAVGVSRQQRVPLGQVLSLRQSAIRATRWQPLKRIGLIGHEYETLGDFLRAILVIHAATGTQIKQSARDVGVEDLVGIFILNLVQTTKSAPVAQRLPFLAIHFGE